MEHYLYIYLRPFFGVVLGSRQEVIYSYIHEFIHPDYLFVCLKGQSKREGGGENEGMREGEKKREVVRNEG